MPSSVKSLPQDRIIVESITATTINIITEIIGEIPLVLIPVIIRRSHLIKLVYF